MPLRNAHYYTSSPDWLVFSTDPTSPVYALQHPPGPSPSASPSNPSSTNSPTIQERRKALAIEEAANAKEHPLERYGYESIDREVRMRDGGWIRVRVYSPLRKEGKGAGKGLPGLFVTHGGGFFSGSPITEEIFMLRPIWENFDMVIVSVIYRLSPEHPYPIPLDDCWDALQWTYKNASSLSIDPSRLILAGSSAGACLSASLALRSTTTTTNPRILGSILNVPVLCHYAHLPHGKYELKSYEQCEDPSLLLHSAEMREVWDNYTLEHGQGAEPTASPLLADHGGLPPTAIFVAGQDPVRDEGIAYHQALEAAGVPSTLHIYQGVPHSFAEYPALETTNRFRRDLVEWLKGLLGGTKCQD